MARKKLEKPKPHKHHAVQLVEVCSCGATRVNGGDWETGKSPVGVMMGAKALAMSTPEERHERAKSGAAERWRGKTPTQRKEFMRWMASHPRPTRRIAERCPCGRYSLTYAAARRHKCTAPEAQDVQ